MSPHPLATEAGTKTAALKFGRLRRIAVLTSHTFTQLVRMKVFYFLLIFCAALYLVGFLFSSVSPDQELKLIKDTALATIQWFGLLFGVAATAMLIPKDLEDRTIYTILCKPVRRLDYLLGKFFGVILVIALSMLIMDVLFTIVLTIKHRAVVAQQETYYDGNVAKAEEYFTRQFAKFPNERARVEASRARDLAEIAAERKSEGAKLARLGPTWELQAAVLSHLLKACVITATTLLVSTFAGSTIFTIIVSLVIIVIGFMQQTAREGMFADADEISPLQRAASGVVAMFFPDFQIYNIADGIAAGDPLPNLPVIILQMLGLTLVYVSIHITAAYYFFSDKEL